MTSSQVRQAVKWFARSIQHTNHVLPSMTEIWREFTRRSPRDDDGFRLACNLGEMFIVIGSDWIFYTCEISDVFRSISEQVANDRSSDIKGCTHVLHHQDRLIVGILGSRRRIDHDKGSGRASSQKPLKTISISQARRVTRRPGIFRLPRAFPHFILPTQLIEGRLGRAAAVSAARDNMLTSRPPALEDQKTYQLSRMMPM